LPDEIPELKFDIELMPILELIVKVGFAPSNNEARRLVKQGGVSVDGEKVTDLNFIVYFDKEKILKVGKRNFIKLTT